MKRKSSRVPDGKAVVSVPCPAVDTRTTFAAVRLSRNSSLPARARISFFVIVEGPIFKNSVLIGSIMAFDHENGSWPTCKGSTRLLLKCASSEGWHVQWEIDPRSASSFFSPPVLILPWVQEIGACRGEIGLVTGDDSEPMPKGGGGDQAVDGGYRFFQPGQQPTPFVRDASIDGQNTVFEPCGQLCFRPRGYLRTPPTAPSFSIPFRISPNVKTLTNNASGRAAWNHSDTRGEGFGLSSSDSAQVSIRKLTVQHCTPAACRARCSAGYLPAVTSEEIPSMRASSA